MKNSLSDLEKSLARKYKALSPEMDERGRRLWAAAEMREIGRGGKSAVHRATGLDWKTINRGNRDLTEQETTLSSQRKTRRIRKKGGGRKSIQLKDLTLLSDLNALRARNKISSY